MTQDQLVGQIPPKIAEKVEKVLGVTPEELGTYTVETIIEELCDTALMFDESSRAKKKS